MNMTDEPAKRCPSAELLGKMSSLKELEWLADVAAHVFVCEDCQRSLKELMSKVDADALSADENRTAEDFVKERCLPFDAIKALKSWVLAHPPVPRALRHIDFRKSSTEDWRMVAAKHGIAQQGESNEDDTVRFVYLSEKMCNDPDFWRADVTIASIPDSSSVMHILVRGCKGVPACGAFSICGCSVQLENGVGSLPYADFVKGIKCNEVYLRQPNGNRVDGALVFL